MEVDEDAFETEFALLRREGYRCEVEPYNQRITAFRSGQHASRRRPFFKGVASSGMNPSLEVLTVHSHLIGCPGNTIHCTP